MTARPRLTLVSAPAGFGKTTLLAQWLAAPTASAPPAGSRGSPSTRPTATPRRSGPTCSPPSTAPRPGTGASALELLGAGQPTEAVLAAAVNELSVLPDDVLLVLDDYHLAESPEVQQGVAFLVDHLPPQVHLVISTRADPGLPLARLRARGELTEVRAADLRFTDPETSRFLGDATGRDLDTRRTSPPSAPARRAGSRRSSSPPCPCGAGTTRPPSSPGSPATTGSSSTTSSRRSSTGSPTRCASSSSRTAVLDRLTRPAVRRRHRHGRRATGRSSRPGAPQPLPRPARRPAAVVPLPPPVRRRAPRPPARDPSGGCRGAAPPRRRLVRGRGPPGGGGPARPGRRGHRAGRGPRRGVPAPRCAASAARR